MTTADIALQHQQWLMRQAKFTQLELEADRTVWDVNRLKRYRNMGYSPKRLAEMSGYSILAVLDVVFGIKGRRREANGRLK